MELHEKLAAQRRFFAEGATKDPAFRVKALCSLRDWIKIMEQDILDALYEDLGKAPMEGYMSEVGMVLDELSYLIKATPHFAKPRRVRTPLSQWSAKSFVVKEPYGSVLVMAPWNYPFQLCMEPLCGALSAGNCAVVKPSNYAPHTSRVICDILAKCFSPEYVFCVEGGREQNSLLLKEKFDYIFFTGGVTVGKLVMRSAAEYLTPVSLELGGKSPCIVDRTANIPLAAKRIAFGKFLNAGQTCVAPDYLLCDELIKEELVACLRAEITRFFGLDPLTCPEYPKIVNEKHMCRLTELLTRQGVPFAADMGARKLAPVVVDGVSPEDPLMEEELFGPILPVLTFKELCEAKALILSRPKPLALYLFTSSAKAQKEIVRDISFGGGCIGDTVIHLATHRMGFGGVGESGMGAYHGRYSFDTFTHEKSIVKKKHAGRSADAVPSLHREKISCGTAVYAIK